MEPATGSSSADKQGISTVSEPSQTESITNLDDICHVKHGHFKWSVEKISNFPWGKGIYCYSPTFELEGTWWYLALCLNAENSEQHSISLVLLRHNRDPGPEIVATSHCLGLENFQSKIWFKKEDYVVFGKGDSDSFQTSVLGNLNHFLSEGGAKNDDTLTVTCEMYVSYNSKKSKSPTKISPIDQSLSLDLINLFNSQKEVDVWIAAKNYRVRVHKSILCARSRTLARMLENDKFDIQLSCDISCLTCAILYMYSGSFEYIAEKAVFSIGLYELACELYLNHLRDLLVPHKVDKKSHVERRTLKKTCTIYTFDLAQLSNHNVIDTPVCLDRESGMSVKILLYKLDSFPECVGIDVEIGGVPSVFHSFLSVSFLNKNSTPFKEVKADSLPNSVPEFRNSTLFATFWISNADIQPCITNENLYINVECTKYYLNHTSDLSANLMSLSHSRKNWIEELSNDLNELFKSGKFSDFTLVVENQKIKVHRFILAARCPLFYSWFYEKNFKGSVLGIKDIEHRILEIILTYIYCGTISHLCDLTKEDFSKLIIPSMVCKLRPLVQISAQFWLILQ